MSKSFLTDIDGDLKGILKGEFSQHCLLLVGSLEFEVDCVIDNTFLMVSDGDTPVQSNNPAASIHITEIDEMLGAELSEDDDPILKIDDVHYRIVYIERDGTGFARMILKKTNYAS